MTTMTGRDFRRLVVSAALIVTMVLIGAAKPVAHAAPLAPRALSVSANGPYTSIVGRSITFAASVSGALLGATSTCTWSFGDGAGGFGCTTSHSYNAPGTYTVTVNASSNDEFTSDSTIASITGGLSCSPGGPYSGQINRPITFTASVSGANAPFTYTWDFDDGSTGQGQTVSHVYSTTGAFAVSLTASSGSTGQSVPCGSTGVTVVGGAASVSAGGPYTSIVGRSITFTANSSGNPLSGNVTCSWSFGDGASGSGCTTAHAYNAPGNYSVTVVASADGQNSSDTTSASITGGLSCTPGGPYAAQAGQAITLSASVSGANAPFTYTWDFGDGSTGQGTVVNHSYGAAGSYTVGLTASSGSTGQSVSCGTTSVTITPPPISGPSVTYQPGWNLIGGPTGTSFSQCAGALYTFQAGDANYQIVQTTSPAIGGRGYWCYATGPLVVALNGSSASTVAVVLPVGQYVMAGNPSATQTLTVRGADVVYAFNTSTNGYVATTALAPGQGVWIESNAGGTATIGP